MFDGMAPNGSNGCSGGNGNNGDDSDDNNANSDYWEIGSNGNDIVPPADAARHEKECHQREARPEIIIDPALLADQQGGQLLSVLSMSSASILVSTETMISMHHLPETVYGPAIPAADHAILCKPKESSTVEMSAQIDELMQLLEDSHVHANQACNMHDTQAAQLGLCRNACK
jgi:hypothetical protein